RLISPLTTAEPPSTVWALVRSLTSPSSRAAASNAEGTAASLPHVSTVAVVFVGTQVTRRPGLSQQCSSRMH
ncbi:MAG TPA: hypothetical protein VJV74_00555, partial [Terriglobia bacterium]|nr:hypothetical protein [Terriglobia bacterium]